MAAWMRSKRNASACNVIDALKSVQNTEKARHAERFFRAGRGEYGEGDRFLGISVPQVRAVARRLREEFRELPVGEAIAAWKALLQSPWHEVRLCALILAAERLSGAQVSALKDRERWARAYLQALRSGRINNWDLVDTSAPLYVGAWWKTCAWIEARRMLVRLADSSQLWERRVAIIATFAWLRDRELSNADAVRPTLFVAERLMRPKKARRRGGAAEVEHDLIQKAVGWLLREVGKRDAAALRLFLNQHAASLPRTTLRYALERQSGRDRKRWMAMRR